ncbi:hypothetical protein BUL40_00305 [Croceivirga radicis]|uniref:Uncharacterized protein n=1 Tax=Croceivirga radicis TaxID=1929488 RepID=A0A1V6LV33_9FLAO|nr:hypothetical protein [Croceivirga radicis]OQD44033.1 hypothetical protein BUL40_00305 [Croceivirga radicis]
MYQPTLGEDYIANYFIENGIKYKEQVKEINLKGDVKNYRVIDFYLPTLKVYVEYYGLYNKSKLHRQDYDTKTDILIKNRMPTVILTPEDLGILDYSFHSKLHKLYAYPIYYSRWSILRYSLNRYIRKGKPHFFFFAFVFYVIGVLISDNISNGYTESITLKDLSAIILFLIALFYFFLTAIMNFLKFVEVHHLLIFLGLKKLDKAK